VKIGKGFITFYAASSSGSGQNLNSLFQTIGKMHPPFPKKARSGEAIAPNSVTIRPR